MTEEIIAPLSGKILSIEIAVGQKVEEDDDAIIIEAMKMETSIYVPCDGTITEIKVKEGDEVEEDDILAIIEES
ncbi:acetyl-CoA carboxylase biotin carboxyl carrier protein subunit [bacterium]|nr:acetyl-CoA carboxylase biotin carboxyl carrier protein subunit [bacterium]